MMVALAARADLPWSRVDWYLADERCGAPDDPLAHAQVARASLFTPRGIVASSIHVPALDAGDPDEIARRYADTIAAVGAFDLVLLGISGDGALGQLVAGSAALDGAASVAVVRSAGEPPRIALTPVAFARAKYAIVTAVGPETARAVAAALRNGSGAPARLLPSERVTWVVDRAAAAELLADARPVDETGG